MRIIWESRNRVVCANGFIDIGTRSEYLSPLRSGKAGSEVTWGAGCVGRHQDSPGTLGLQSPHCPQLAVCPWSSHLTSLSLENEQKEFIKEADRLFLAARGRDCLILSFVLDSDNPGLFGLQRLPVSWLIDTCAFLSPAVASHLCSARISQGAPELTIYQVALFCPELSLHVPPFLFPSLQGKLGEEGLERQPSGGEEVAFLSPSCFLWVPATAPTTSAFCSELLFSC